MVCDEQGWPVRRGSGLLRSRVSRTGTQWAGKSWLSWTVGRGRASPLGQWPHGPSPAEAGEGFRANLSALPEVGEVHMGEHQAWPRRTPGRAASVSRPWSSFEAGGQGPEIPRADQE